MGRNRYKDVVEVESSEGSDDAYFDDNDSDNENHRHNYHGSNFPYVGDEDKIKRDAYKQVMKEYAELKIIKRKLAMSLSCEASKQQCLKIPNVTSTSFSVSTFGSVIDSLTPAYRKVIEDFGFGSLLMFDKCIVPSKFVKWVASLVNYRSGDVVIDGKVISLTKQSVNLVLGLPISDKPFPVNYAVGKSIVLSRFGKHSIPSVSYFADKLVKKESMPDEDVLICFLLVALNSFLCSNSNLVPSYKYFGIFEDLVNAKDLDWCGYILNWLLEDDGAHAHYSQFDINAVHRSSPTLKSNIAHEDCSQSDTFDSSNDDSHRIIHLPVPNLPQSASIRSDSETNAQAQTSGAARLLEKVSKNSITPPIQKTHTRFVPPPSGYAPNHPVHHLLYGKSNCSQTEKTQPLQQPGSIPLGDSTNTLSSKKRKKSVSFITKEDHLKDVILLDDEPRYYVPDSISPSPKPGYTRYYSQKENVSPGTSQQTPIHAQDLDLSPQISARTNLIASKPRSGPSAKAKSQAQHSLVNSQHKVCPEVEILAETTLADNVRIMTQKCDEIYNSKLKRSGHSDDTPKDVIPSNLSSCHFATHTQPFRIRESTTGGQSPVHGPRRVIKPAPLFNDDYATAPKGFHVSKSQVDNYSIICKLASSRYQCEDAVNLSGVRCTFWALGDSLKPEGLVKSFVISAFCYSLFQRRNGHPDSSKRHYFFPNIADNLLKDIDDADEDVLSRAFGRSSKARPLSRSNMLFFPTCVADHWFLFVVDITDRKYVILDSVHNKDSEFQEVVRERLRNSFQFHWKKFVKLDMGFPRYEFSYPHVPQQPSDNNSDSGIYVMIFISCH
ncbi:unnamed protein product [Urochloa decumbens]|uniref:Ubiquitin-like protease family profile domain-containing protein n=1 Tax=Urochloa decumbens TaxID=240449 RepID=A0ABC9H4A1_9POAL